MQSMAEHYPFQNFPLPYAYDALEPYIDTKTMHLHHDKHLQTYIDNLNRALSACPAQQNSTLPQLLCCTHLPRAKEEEILHNAGGVWNHRLYFAGLASAGSKVPSGALAEAISCRFGSFEAFQQQFTAAALSVFGSGYAWLAAARCGRLLLFTTPNQETTLCRGLRPLLCLDVWEHAYYLKHFNKRVDYIADWFQVVNWAQAEQQYAFCSRKNAKNEKQD
jgi:Fe-Mn family superoxide dismutase